MAGGSAVFEWIETRIDIMHNLLCRFLKDSSGVAAIEYGLIAGLIAVVIIGAVSLLGTNVSNKFTAVAGALT
jgi:pilus assembly protein Flp/PilA